MAVIEFVPHSAVLRDDYWQGWGLNAGQTTGKASTLLAYSLSSSHNIILKRDKIFMLNIN